jgi:spore coat polysaccharide biosynthesis predicted glycosyltransferase SpsG
MSRNPQSASPLAAGFGRACAPGDHANNASAQLFRSRHHMKGLLQTLESIVFAAGALVASAILVGAPLALVFWNVN